MEPTDLNFSSSEDSHLAVLLRQAQPALPDGGFSHRVLASLPGRLSPKSSRSRSILCAVGTAVGVALALNAAASSASLAASTDEFRAAFARTSELLLQSSAGSTPAGLWLAFVVTLASLLFAFKPRLRSWL